MDHRLALQRFAFLAEAFDGSGGFAPEVSWQNETISTTDQAGNALIAIRRVPKLAGPCYLVPHSREGAEKFAGRCALAVYENHLRDACDRYISFLARRRPMRTGTEAPLTQLLIGNADMRGTSLDQFLMSFALQLKARGSMLLLLDLPGQEDDAPPSSLKEQIERRAVPYLREIPPEVVHCYDLDDETGLFETITIKCVEDVDGEPQECLRTWDAQTWSVKHGDKTIRHGVHGFGQCPVLAATETGGLFPQVGRFAQIADMSRSIYNATSGLDEILRSQTFSVPVMQVPADQAASFDANKMAVILGTHNLLIYPGERPDYISPDAAQAQVYRDVIGDRQQSIKRVAMEEATADAGSPVESGVARRLRFERLNADLTGFSAQMQGLEQRMWSLFHRAIGTSSNVKVEWPSDFNLIDTAAELDILSLFMATGMPEAVLQAKREAIVNAEFDASDEDTKAALMAALDEASQAAQEPAASSPTLALSVRTGAAA